MSPSTTAEWLEADARGGLRRRHRREHPHPPRERRLRFRCRHRRRQRRLPPRPSWHRQFLYTEVRDRGLDRIEDLASPGVFTWAPGTAHSIMVLCQGDGLAVRAAPHAARVVATDGPAAPPWPTPSPARQGPISSIATRFLAPLLAYLDEAGIGHLTEVADGDAPHRPGGCPFQARSLGELIRIRNMTDPA